MKYLHAALIIFCTVLMLNGCSKQETTKEEPPPSPPLPIVKKSPAPTITITIGSISLASVQKRIEKIDIAEIAKLVKQEKLDILTVQSIARYPELKNRIDLYDEIGTQTEMRKVFGENITVSGRQTGNAVYSTFPILSNHTTHYDGISSSGFESALQAVIDCGAREVVVVCTRLPEKTSPADIAVCSNTLASMSTYYIDHPLVITGNLPVTDASYDIAGYNSAKQTKNMSAPQVWYSKDGSLKLLNVKVVSTPLAPVTISEFGVYKKTQP